VRSHGLTCLPDRSDLAIRGLRRNSPASPFFRSAGVDLFDFPFTTRMPTFAINVRSLFHSRTLCTAIFSRRDLAGTDGMGAFLALIRCHMVPPLLNQPKDWMCASKERRHANPSILLSGKRWWYTSRF
jgi:hypothetical protein